MGPTGAMAVRPAKPAAMASLTTAFRSSDRAHGIPCEVSHIRPTSKPAGVLQPTSSFRPRAVRRMARAVDAAGPVTSNEVPFRPAGETSRTANRAVGTGPDTPVVP